MTLLILLTTSARGDEPAFCKPGNSAAMHHRSMVAVRHGISSRFGMQHTITRPLMFHLLVWNY